MSVPHQGQYLKPISSEKFILTGNEYDFTTSMRIDSSSLSIPLEIKTNPLDEFSLLDTANPRFPFNFLLSLKARQQNSFFIFYIYLTLLIYLHQT